MDGDLEGEVIRGGGGGAEVKDTNVGVGGNAREDVGGMWRERGGIGTAMRGESEERVRAMRRPDANGTVPAGRAETVFGDEIPVYAEDFAVVFSPVLDGEIVQVAVEELDAAIARCCQDLVLVYFRPGKVVEGVLSGEPDQFNTRSAWDIPLEQALDTGRAPFRRDNPIGSQFQYKQPPISYKPIVGRACDSESVVEEGRVFDRTAVVAFGAETEHVRVPK